MPTGQEMAPLNEKAQLLRKWLNDLPPIEEGAAQVISANYDSIEARGDEGYYGQDPNRHLEVFEDQSSNSGSSDSGKTPPNKNKKKPESSLWISMPTALPATATSMVGPPIRATIKYPIIESTKRPSTVQSTMRPSTVESTSIVLSTAVSIPPDYSGSKNL
ncbi:hypothetical protein PG984_004705 [Apiospora sp. TS-2023a]